MRLHRLASPDLGRIFRGETVSGLSEWQLLERYLDQRDEVAFEALVVRHGPMVLGVCRRMLGDSADADDAFQATFLVLVRRARQLGPRDAIGPWLYGVAARVALRARSQAARHRRHEPIAIEFPVIAPLDPRVDAEMLEVLDQELSRLPSKYRDPLVLCYLEGRTHEEAARDLNWPVGTVKGRLARARNLMRSRLTRRGLAPTAGALASCLAPPSTSVLESPLIGRTVNSSLKLAAGQSVNQVVSVSITSLVEGVLSAMILSKLKWAALAALVTGVAFTSAAVMARQEVKKSDTISADAAAIKPYIDDTPRKVAGVDPLQSPAAVEEARPRTRPVRSDGTPPEGAGAIGGEEEGRAKDPRSLKILEKLEEPISMSFATETALDDVLKYIKQATTTPKYSGIPIYVDPLGLQEAERSLNSTVTMDLEGIPLRRTLQLMLTQLGLAYFVEDGILVVTAEDSANQPLPPSMRRPSPLMEKMEKAERGDLSLTEIEDLLKYLKARETLLKLKHGLSASEQATFTAPATHAGAGGGGGRGGVVQDETKHKPDQVELLIKEMRELVEQLKAERQAREAPLKKSAWRRLDRSDRR
jgi:RNA polymerase sigma factor (sigma-70 family)